jgi:polysaccharide biosynthesis protein PslJ
MSVFEVTRPTRAQAASPPSDRVRTSSLGWQAVLITLVLVIWLIPVKRYQFPVTLPFKLEPYRLFVLILLGGLIISALVGRRRINAAGHGKALLLLAGAALASQAANKQAIDAIGLQTQSLKALSYYLSFLVVFALMCSALQVFGEVRAMIVTLVVAGTIVAVAALYESRFHNNLFDHLEKWFPFLQNTGEDKFKVRSGRLRVRASSQHPIALGISLLMMAPLALYLARYAASKLRQRLWILAALVLGMGAIITVSRTVVVVTIAMIVAAKVIRRLEFKRLLPLLLALILLTHAARPGATKALYHAFTPKQGLLEQQQGRAGLAGSGRLSDIGPGLRRWSQRPIFGRGLGTNPTRANPVIVEAQGAQPFEGIIFDDEYMETLVSLGFIGFVGVLWFIWGAIVKLGRSARRTAGELGDLLGACAVSCVGFAAGMLTLDAFSFVQVTLLFYIVAAVGLRARALMAEQQPATPT